MKVDRELVRHLEILARLTLTEEEEMKMIKDMNDILAYVEKIGELDLHGVEPTYTVVEARTVLRKDEVRKGLAQKMALANVPAKKGNFIKVSSIQG